MNIRPLLVTLLVFGAASTACDPPAYWVGSVTSLRALGQMCLNVGTTARPVPLCGTLPTKGKIPVLRVGECIQAHWTPHASGGEFLLPITVAPCPPQLGGD